MIKILLVALVLIIAAAFITVKILLQEIDRYRTLYDDAIENRDNTRNTIRSLQSELSRLRKPKKVQKKKVPKSVKPDITKFEL